MQGPLVLCVFGILFILVGFVLTKEAGQAPHGKQLGQIGAAMLMIALFWALILVVAHVAIAFALVIAVLFCIRPTREGLLQGIKRATDETHRRR